MRCDAVGKQNMSHPYLKPCLPPVIPQNHPSPTLLASLAYSTIIIYHRDTGVAFARWMEEFLVTATPLGRKFHGKGFIPELPGSSPVLRFTALATGTPDDRRLWGAWGENSGVSGESGAGLCGEGAGLLGLPTKISASLLLLLSKAVKLPVSSSIADRTDRF